MMSFSSEIARNIPQTTFCTIKKLCKERSDIDNESNNQQRVKLSKQLRTIISSFSQNTKEKNRTISHNRNKHSMNINYSNKDLMGTKHNESKPKLEKRQSNLINIHTNKITTNSTRNIIFQNCGALGTCGASVVSGASGPSGPSNNKGILKSYKTNKFFKTLSPKNVDYNPQNTIITIKSPVNFSTVNSMKNLNLNQTNNQKYKQKAYKDDQLCDYLSKQIGTINLNDKNPKILKSCAEAYLNSLHDVAKDGNIGVSKLIYVIYQGLFQIISKLNENLANINISKANLQKEMQNEISILNQKNAEANSKISELENALKQSIEKARIIEKKLEGMNKSKSHGLENKEIQTGCENLSLDKENYYFNTIIKQKADLKKCKKQITILNQRENKLIYFFNLCEEKGYPVQKIYDDEVRHLETDRFEDEDEEESENISNSKITNNSLINGSFYPICEIPKTKPKKPDIVPLLDLTKLKKLKNKEEILANRNYTTEDLEEAKSA